MSTKLPPRKTEDQRSPSHAKAVMEQYEHRVKWLSRHREEILEPDLPIIDAHHHLWVRPGNRYLLDEFLAEVRTGHNIKASVFVDCGSFYRKTGPVPMAPVGEVEFANGVAAMAASGTYGNTLVCAGIVSSADISVGAEVAQVLDAQIAAGGGRFRGIRVTTKWDADEALNTGRYIVPRGLMQDRDFRAGFATLAPRKLSFDAMIYHPQLLELADLARAFPDTTIVLNHIGGLLAWTRHYLARRDEAIAQWRSSMVELAKCPNVFVKLGGLGMAYLGLGFDKREAPASSAQLAESWGPLYTHCIDTFGPDHCMFESNFPPDRDSVDYPVIWNAFKRIAARYAADEKRALFYGTAAKAYRLNPD
ncbi:MAG TPA: amidohydrolase family protein [Burkholderiales bacterium]|nr:amidohydrolase family protein [Burkholderiales bacterium]